MLLALRLFGLLRIFSIPTGGMSPAVAAGDRVIMEALTYLSRKPRRGDIVVFKTDGLSTLPPGQFYNKRLIGEPGDHLQLADGKLFINEQRVTLSNSAGEIIYNLPPNLSPSKLQLDVTVPKDSYFVVGDESTKSFDSRFFGVVPHNNIVGRVIYCCSPVSRIGRVK
jgi:signal peptidase I